MIFLRTSSLSSISVVLFCSMRASPALAQLLPSQAMGMARAQIVMLTVDQGSSGAGIIVGFDERTVYIATAEHVPNFLGEVLPKVNVTFPGLSYSPRKDDFDAL